MENKFLRKKLTDKLLKLAVLEEKQVSIIYSFIYNYDLLHKKGLNGKVDSCESWVSWQLLTQLSKMKYKTFLVLNFPKKKFLDTFLYLL